MSRHAVRTIFAILVCLLAFASAAPAQFTGVTPTTSTGLNVHRPLTTDPSILFPADREMRLLPGDLLTVQVYGVLPAYSDNERIALDGTVHLPLAGSIHLANLSLQDAENAVADRFEAAGMFHNPEVAIQVIDAPGHSATLIGEVRAVVPVLGYRRLFDVLATAGGLPQSASTVISIDRPGLAQQIVVDVTNDPASNASGSIPIFAGDTITVGRVGSFYVVGAVTRPGVTPLTGGTPVTALQALSAAGGPTFPAELDDTKLIRTVGTQRTVINLHLRKIQHGHEPDPILQSDDILMVPSSVLRALIRNGGLVTIVGLGVTLAAFLR